MVSFESALERDLATSLEFDDDVVSYQEQPLFVHYVGSDGCARRGVPDFLICFQPPRVPVLCDVKYRAELLRAWPRLKPRFKAALATARDRGWRYRIFTEREIRTPFLENAKFLLPYRHRPQEPDDTETILFALRQLGEWTPAGIVAAISSSRVEQTRLLTAVWTLIANRAIQTDLHTALTMSSRIWRG